MQIYEKTFHSHKFGLIKSVSVNNRFIKTKEKLVFFINLFVIWENELLFKTQSEPLRHKMSH